MTTSDTVRSTVTEDGVVLLDTTNGNIFTSNAVGARLWLKLQDGLNLDNAIAQISAEFNVEPERARADIEEFVQTAAQSGLLTK